MSPVLTSEEKPSVRTLSDTYLVKECLAGNQEAWSQLIEKYKSLIYSVPVRYGLQAEDAADVFQGTCMELLSRLPELRQPKALPKWLMQVAYHKCYHLKRQQQRLVSRDGDPDLPEPVIPAIAETLVRQTEEEQMLREAILTLSPQCRRLVHMLFFELPARPYTEVARELGLAVGSIGLTRQKCVGRLRKRLEAIGFV